MNKIAILSTTTVNQISKNFIKDNNECILFQYSEMDEAVFKEDSNLYKYNPEFIILIIDQNNSHKLELFLNKLLNKFKSSKIIVTSIVKIMPDVLNFLNTENLNSCILEKKNIHKNIICLDLNYIFMNFKETLFDPKYYYLSNIYYSLPAQELIYENIKNLIFSIKYRKKCIICDLDNTLWSGTLDGNDISFEGINKSYLDFQILLKKLIESGTIFCICSKNDEKQAINFIENNENMIIKMENVASYRINWENKYKNIIEISKEINISTKDMVFIDDSPHERNEVKNYINDIEVPEVPVDPVYYCDFLSKLNYFETLNITDEDLKRNKSYKIQKIRNLEKEKFSDYFEYLNSLEIKCKIIKGDKNYNRISQITKRTNQFNTCGNSYNEEDIKKMDVYSLYYKDKFEDNGIVGLFVLQDDNIKDIYISCRVFGRGLENLILNYVFNIFNKDFFINFIENNKNNYSKNKFLELGLEFKDNKFKFKKCNLVNTFWIKMEI